jgi:hypothetical protein
MKLWFTGAQGAQEIFRSFLRLLTAILFCSLPLSSIRAQGNTPTSRSQVATNQLEHVEGELEIIQQDFKDGRGHLQYSLKQADGTRLSLQFTKEPPTHLLTGMRVRAHGQRSGGTLVLYSGNTNLSTDASTTTATSAIPVPNTFGVQSTLVILVNFQDKATEPFTSADAYNAIFGTANNFFLENSYGQTSLTGDVVGWYTMPDSIATCNMSQIATDAKGAAVAAGINLSNYTRYVYVFPYNTTCGWAGSSFVGGNPSESWINGDALDIHIINHELGHAFGIWHSHLLDCGTSATIGSSCTVSEYGDLLDVMGVPQTASADYNSFQKERLGWLNYGVSPSIQTVQASGTYTINTYELSSSGPNALKILKSIDATTGAKTWYYLEARQALGFDAFLTAPTYYTQNETNGVLFHIGTDGNGNSSDLLDMTPSTPTSTGWFDASLAAGQSFQDSSAGVTITTTSVNSAGATVQVTMNGSSSCAEANPTVTITPSQGQSVIPGTAENFSVTVTNNDSSSCASATYSLANAVPSGWTGTLSTAMLSLSPGKSGSSMLTVTSPVGTADGSYNIGVSATNTSASSYSGSVAATYVINSAPLTISLTTNQSIYLPGQTVTVAVTVLNGTLPDAGASVTVSVTTPNGRSTTLSGATGSNGVALLSYKLSNRATAGTYRAQYGANSKGGKSSVSGASSAAGASTTFIVQ